jgi:hypothetical protein
MYKYIETNNGMEIVYSNVRDGTKYGVSFGEIRYGDPRPSDTNPMIDGVHTASEIQGRIAYLEDFLSTLDNEELNNIVIEQIIKYKTLLSRYELLEAFIHLGQAKNQ